jgi:hypothetical protein
VKEIKKTDELVLPIHDLVQKLFTAKVVSCLAFDLVQPLFDDALRGDASMVKAGSEQRSLSQHAIPAPVVNGEDT